ncbi:MAG TPA: hypothetical protein VLG71_02950 [Candidatus Limnocylindria bacterium]|nr:hypothetical protein [Candidatus Limnocylindria bacterium]
MMQNRSKKLIICLLAASSLATARPMPTVTGHSFFSVQPLFIEGTPELNTLYNRYLNECDLTRGCGVFSATILGSSSVHWDKDSNNLTSYFFPFNKNCLVVGEFGSQAVQNNQADLIANYFGVETANPMAIAGEYDFSVGSYQSIITMKPKQTVIGVGLAYFQKLTNPDGPKGFWLAINTPIVKVRNNLRFREKVLNAGSGNTPAGYVSTISDALHGATVFGNKFFQYGRVPNCENGLSKTGLADIEVKVGRTNICRECCHVASYVGLVIPTGNRPKGEYIFEPIVGNNKHWEILLGTKYGFKVWDCPERDWRIWCEGIVSSRYIIPNTQRRSVDLIDKQWSRYLWLYPNANATSITDITPGINLLTLHLKVHPRFNFNKYVSFTFNAHDRYLAEAGYTINIRQAERICLACPFDQGPGIVGIDANNTTVLHTKTNATIRQYGSTQAQFINVDVNPNVSSTSAFVPITHCDLDFTSAAQPACISQTVFASVGYRLDGYCHEPFVGLGGSFEFSSENTCLQRATGWLKGGFNW